jgi:hypothetical protein
MPPSNETETDGLAVAVVLTLELAKIARVLVRLDHVARFIVNANHSIIRPAEKLRVADCVTDRIRLGYHNRPNRNKLSVIVRVKYWQIIADNLSKVGWSWGCVSAVDSHCRGRTTSLFT